jgi:hypothetical protein
MKNLIYILLLISSPLFADTYYVAIDGDDGDPGTKAEPFLTIQYGIDLLIAGDSLIIRGGTYFIAAFLSIDGSEDGTEANPIVVTAYTDETVIIDATNLTSQSATWIRDAEYWYFEDLIVQEAGQDGATNESSGFLIDRCEFLYFTRCIARYNEGYGFIAGQNCDSIYFTNCDAYENFDPDSPTPGNSADGFAVVGDFTDNTAIWGRIFITGCRAWLNSDDGIDIGYGCYTEVDSCWNFSNGYQSTVGGDGYRCGLLSYDPPANQHIATNCLSVYNDNKGFYLNSHGDAGICDFEWYNNTSMYNDRVGFQMNYGSSTAGNRILKNNIAYGNIVSETQFASGLTYTDEYNDWNDPPDVVVTDADFGALPDSSTSMNILTAARQSDGSLPDIGDNYKLAKGSDLVDAGTDVGLPYNGSAPDLGAFESSPPLPPPSTGYKLTGGDGNLLIVPGDTILIGR